MPFLLGKKLRSSLGNYPELTLQAARARANHMADQVKRGVNSNDLSREAATAGSLTVADLSKDFLKQYVHAKELDSAPKYEIAFSTHINPKVGERSAELLTSEEVPSVRRLHASSDFVPSLASVTAVLAALSRTDCYVRAAAHGFVGNGRRQA